GATRYCFPPVCMTAYIAPPPIKPNPDYRSFTRSPSTHENQRHSAKSTVVGQFPMSALVSRQEGKLTRATRRFQTRVTREHHMTDLLPRAGDPARSQLSTNS